MADTHKIISALISELSKWTADYFYSFLSFSVYHISHNFNIAEFKQNSPPDTQREKTKYCCHEEFIQSIIN